MVPKKSAVARRRRAARRFLRWRNFPFKNCVAPKAILACTHGKHRCVFTKCMFYRVFYKKKSFVYIQWYYQTFLTANCRQVANFVAQITHFNGRDEYIHLCTSRILYFTIKVHLVTNDVQKATRPPRKGCIEKVPYWKKNCSKMQL
jgi:hypothetical protein